MSLSVTVLYIIYKTGGRNGNRTGKIPQEQLFSVTVQTVLLSARGCICIDLSICIVSAYDKLESEAFMWGLVVKEKL